MGYRGLQGVTRGYEGIQRGYRSLHVVTGGYKGLKKVKKS